MLIFKAINHVTRKRSSSYLTCTSCLDSRNSCSRSVSVSSLKLPDFCSFPSRFFSSDRHHSTSMELVEAVARRESTSPGCIAIRADRQSYSYHQLISSARRISSLLCNADLKTVDDANSKENLAGARVGIVAKPSAEFVAGVLGTWLSGGVAVPLALSYPEAELLHVINDSDITMILSTEDHQDLVKSVADKTSSQLFILPLVPNRSTVSIELERTTNGDRKGNKSFQGDDPALIIYTSGTTGKPKGAVHTHKGVISQAQMLSGAWGYTSTDQFLHCLPLHHVHGLYNALLAPLYAGSTVEFMPKFSVRGVWQRWRESYPSGQTKSDDAITVFTGVPTIYTRLIQGYEAMDPALQADSASAARELRLMMCGSSALPLPVMQQWENITGHRLLERYGMTEFVMALSNPLIGERKGGTVGQPLPGVQAKIIVEDGSGDGNDGVGELCIKSPSLFKEYWKLPEVTKQSFIEDGFFKTGDAARVDDDGYYVIMGRTNADIMKVGGYKLSALEIEAVLLEHPSISECCVLGLPDKTYGEAVCAIIVPDPGLRKTDEEETRPALTLGELSIWAQERLAPYKVSQHIHFFEVLLVNQIPTRLLLWESLPRNAMGKVNKKELKRKLAGEE